MRRFRWNFFPFLNKTVVAYIFSFSNEDENERRTLGEADFAIYIKIGRKRNGFRLHFVRSVSNENENERRTLGYGGFAILTKKNTVMSEKVFASILSVSNEKENQRRTLGYAVSL